MDEVDIWRAADQMIRLYGEDALLRAAMRADALLDQGDSLSTSSRDGVKGSVPVVPTI
jgi:hypothetical protein